MNEPLDLLRLVGRADDHAPHPLVCHLIDTMETTRALYPTLLGDQVRTELDEVFGPLTGGDREQTAAWAGLLCGLSDLGMYSPAHQSGQLDLALERFPESEAELLRSCAKGHQRGAGTDHTRITGVHLHLELAALGVHQALSLTLSDLLAGHHGHLPIPAEVLKLSGKRGGRLRNDIGNGHWREGRSAMVRELARLSGVDFAAPAWAEVSLGADRAARARALNPLMALATVSVRAASDPDVCPSEPAPARWSSTGTARPRGLRKPRWVVRRCNRGRYGGRVGCGPMAPTLCVRAPCRASGRSVWRSGRPARRAALSGDHTHKGQL